jgi:ubiquilin
MVRLTVKPTAGGNKIELDTGLEKTVLELKEELAPSCSIPATEQRLVWRGQILKDERSLESYGASSQHHPRRPSAP